MTGAKENQKKVVLEKEKDSEQRLFFQLAFVFVPANVFHSPFHIQQRCCERLGISMTSASKRKHTHTQKHSDMFAVMQENSY